MALTTFFTMIFILLFVSGYCGPDYYVCIDGAFYAEVTSALIYT